MLRLLSRALRGRRNRLSRPVAMAMASGLSRAAVVDVADVADALMSLRLMPLTPDASEESDVADKKGVRPNR